MVSINILIAFFSVFLALIMIYTNWKLNRYVLFLAFYILIVSFSIIFYDLLVRGGSQDLLLLMMGISQPLFFLSGPFFYFFIRGMLDEKYYFGSKDFLHFTPFYLIVLMLVPYFIEPLSDKVAYINLCMRNLPYFMKSSFVSLPNWVVLQVSVLHAILYILVALWYAHKANQKQKTYLRSLYQKQHKRNYAWFILLIIVTLAMGVFHLGLSLAFMMDIKMKPMYDFMLTKFYFFSSFVFICFFPIVYLLNPGVLYAYPAMVKLNPLVREAKFKLDDNRNYTVLQTLDRNLIYNNYFTKLSQKIILYIEENRPFLDPHFSIEKLSGELSIPKQHIHFCVRNNNSSSYIKMMNGLRVDYFMTAFLSEENKQDINLQSLAYKSGFSSYKNFLKEFKRSQKLSFEDWYAANT